jgi:hypothetical protein
VQYGGTYRYLKRVAEATTSVEVDFLDMAQITFDDLVSVLTPDQTHLAGIAYEPLARRASPRAHLICRPFDPRARPPADRGRQHFPLALLEQPVGFGRRHRSPVDQQVFEWT